MPRVKPRKLTQKQCDKAIASFGFAEKAERILRDNGATHVVPLAVDRHVAWNAPFYNPASRRDWLVATRAGFLGVNIYEDWLACVFDDDEAGARIVGASRPSGKWNHHAFVGHAHGMTSVEEIHTRLAATLAQFERGLQTLRGTP